MFGPAETISGGDVIPLRPANGHDRRRDRTRAKLIAATRELVAEKGVTGLRVSEITERAEVALGSFYNHFESKDELAGVVIEDALRTLTQSLTARLTPGQDAVEIVGNAMRRFVSLAYDDPEFARLIVQIDTADALMAASVFPEGRRALSEGVAAGHFAIDDIENTLITVLGGACALMRAILAGRVGPRAELQFAEHTLRSLGVPGASAARVVSRELPDLPHPPIAHSEP
jgi:AcrR family transcriptional regulator